MKHSCWRLVSWQLVKKFISKALSDARTGPPYVSIYESIVPSVYELLILDV